MNIPLFKVYTDERDVEAVAKVIRRGMNWANGEEIEQFEQKVADYVGTRYAVAFNSGTSALHAALLALGIGKGDEVIVPSFTFPATANMVVAVGAKPVFAEIEEETYGLDAKDVGERQANCSSNPHIMPVHYGGCICRDINLLQAWSEGLGTFIIGDAAESLGAELYESKAGTFEDVTMFSLCAPKVITTGEGGVLVTNHQAHYEALICLRNHGGMTPDGWEVLGYNWRMSSITAALAISQLERIEEAIERRRKNTYYFNLRFYQHSLMEPEMGIKLPNQPIGSRHIFQMYTIRVPEQHRNLLLKHLNDNGIGAKIYFNPVHLMPLYRRMGWKEGDLPITERVSREAITLPMYPDLTTEEMDYMVEKTRGYFER